MPAEKIDCGIRRNPGQPVGRFVEVLDLFAPLKRLNKCFLRKVLSVVYVGNYAVDLQKNPAQVVVNKARLKFPRFLRLCRGRGASALRKPGSAGRVTHLCTRPQVALFDGSRYAPQARLTKRHA